MSWKLFLLEEALGYQFTEDSNGLIMIERMNMLDRYWKEKKDAMPDTDGKNAGTKSNKKGLIK